MNKILYIVGPTATGKTKLALLLAKKFHGEIISADSRQVYQKMDIGSGKDIPKGAVKKNTLITGIKYPLTVYQTKGTNIWGYDTVTPQSEWSIARFKLMAQAIIQHLQHNNKLPIVVGGSGYYINSIQTPPESINIPMNRSLRKKLNTMSLEKLQTTLAKADSERFNKLNNSDKNNPRRLIRAIEIAQYKRTHLNQESIVQNEINAMFIGLDLPNILLDKNIKQRVEQRLLSGFEKEFFQITKSDYLKINQTAASTTGYKQWFEVTNKKTTKVAGEKNWITAEKQYARRQKTWFKKDDRIQWFDAKDKNLNKSVVEFVKNWYPKTNERR